MINLYTISDNIILHSTHNNQLPIDLKPIWIDLYNLTPEEEALVESYLGIDIPTRKEMQHRAVSKRLYEEMAQYI